MSIGGETSDFDVVALIGSAGAGMAGMQVLRGLPAGFAVPLVVAFHLAPDSALEHMYSRLPFRVEWATQGATLEAGKLLLCPPRHFLELLPDGSCMLSRCDNGAIDKPLDRFLESLAHSFASRAIGVVLTGMGSDGTVGALELYRAGGRVVVQSEASAEFPSMPASAIAAGAASIVIPLPELGHLVGELLTNTPRQRMRSEVEAIRRVFGDHGEMAARAREVDWSRTPLGPAVDWPEALRASARTIMDSPNSQALWWGPELIQIYNDAWRTLLGVRKHPQALGGRARETWPEIWHDIGPMVARVMADGIAQCGQDYPLLVKRRDYVEEVFAAFSYSPIRDAAGAVVGVYNNVWETTRNVVTERRLQALRTLTAQLAGAAGVRDACERAAAALGSDPQDLPFALFYVLDERRRQATLMGATGLPPGGVCAPHMIALDAIDRWPIAAALDSQCAREGDFVLLSDLANRCPGLQPVALARDGALPPQSALLSPLRLAVKEAPVGVAVLGLSPHRRFDEGYRSFVDLVMRQVAAGIGQGRAAERERERAERLAELDRAKMQFFANVSHEFRTPLTLLLAPLEELLRQQDSLPAPLAADVEVAVRNARRLLALVTNLLDFSQAEARRQPANLAPADLCALTADIASHFRSAANAAGLPLRIECDAALPEVPVDPEMWTTIVSNLLSNALKFTFEGEIVVSLRALKLHAELEVADTGIGIPENELLHVFKRFHRVRGARARTAEGAGIGLSMVQDLARRMGGQVQVRSREGQGTSFVVWMPFKSPRALLIAGPDAGVEADADLDAASRLPSDLAAEMAEQAARWMGGDEPEGVLPDLVGAPEAPPGLGATGHAGVIVVVDDNADMRSYLRRLLGEHWNVEAAGDAPAGLAAIRRLRPQAVLADVMMPGMDGFELLRSVRADAVLAHTPVVLVTARAGEAAAIEGLMAGADDYVAKPFSPRELLARVRTVIERARAEAGLRTSEARQAYLVRLGDALRPVADPVAIQAAAARLLGEHLGADQVHYGETIAEDTMVIRRGYGHGMPPLVGSFHHGSEGVGARLLATYRAGRTAVCRDVDADPAVSAEEAAVIAGVGFRAYVTVPLVKEGRWVAILAVHSMAPRDWSDDEVVLVEETAERTWAAVERARVEEALRESEQALQRNQVWLAAQNEAFQAAMNGQPLSASLDILVRAAIEKSGGQCRCAFYIADATFTGLRHVVGMPASYAERVDGFAISPESLACGLAVATGEPVITPDVLEEPRWRDWTSLAADYDYRGCWSFPVETSAGRLVGSFAMYWREPRKPTHADIELAATLTHTAAIIVSRHQETRAEAGAAA